MPVIFAAHGAPVLLDDAVWVAELAAWGRVLPRPKAILMVSAHWDRRPATLAATQTVPLFYDFSGFPEKYYQTKYPAPGAPDLAALQRVQARRDFPARMTQRLQLVLQRRIIAGTLDARMPLHPPLALRLLNAVPWLQYIPARLIGIGVRPEHVEGV